MMRSNNASFHLAQGTRLYESVPLWAALMALTPQERRAAMARPQLAGRRTKMRSTIRTPVQGGATAPPSWDGLCVRRTFAADNAGIRAPLDPERSRPRAAAPSHRHAVRHRAGRRPAHAIRIGPTNRPPCATSCATSSSIRWCCPASPTGARTSSATTAQEWSTYFLRMWCSTRGAGHRSSDASPDAQYRRAICGIRDRGSAPGRLVMPT